MGMNILRWFGWEQDDSAFDESRRLFLRRGAAVVLTPVVIPASVSYFFPSRSVVEPACIAASGNTFLDVNWVSMTALRVLQEQLRFTENAGREWDSTFGPKLGRVVHVRKPQRFALESRARWLTRA